MITLLVFAAVLAVVGAAATVKTDPESLAPFPLVPGVLCKEGVHSLGTKQQTIVAIETARNVATKMGLPQVVITSLGDGKHLPQSLHYQGLAVDLRTRHLSKERAQDWAVEIRRILKPRGYDVLNEGPGAGYDRQSAAAHLHIEYDPKAV